LYLSTKPSFIATEINLNNLKVGARGGGRFMVKLRSQTEVKNLFETNKIVLSHNSCVVESPFPEDL
jgi:hypothetical protein